MQECLHLCLGHIVGSNVLPGVSVHGEHISDSLIYELYTGTDK